MRRVVADVLSSDLSSCIATAKEAGDQVDEVAFHESGKVGRHRSRGPAVHNAREVERQGDSAAWAGMRDPASLQQHWPQLWSTMSRAAAAFHSERDSLPTFKGLAKALGENPERSPPEGGCCCDRVRRRLRRPWYRQEVG